MGTSRGTGRYEARWSPTTGDWEVVDRASQSSRANELDQAEAEQLAAELNQRHRVYDEPRVVRVRRNDRWGFGDLTAEEHREDGWYGLIKPDRARGQDWYPERDYHEPDGVFAARQRARGGGVRRRRH
jgi:hypothetical protein